MATEEDIKRYYANLQDETNTAYLYRLIAGIEKDPQLSQVFIKMAEVEESHKEVWAEELRKAGVPAPDCKPDFRSKTLGVVAHVLGTGSVLPILIGGEQSGSGSYIHQPEVSQTKMPIDEKSHERLLITIASQGGKGVEGSNISLLEGRHRAGGGNAF